MRGEKEWTRKREPTVMRTEVEPLLLDFVADETPGRVVAALGRFMGRS